MALSIADNRIVFTSDPVSTAVAIRIRCAQRPKAVSLNGRVVAFEYDQATRFLNVRSEAGKAIRLELLMP